MQRSLIAICDLLATGAVLQQPSGAAETTAADDAIRRTAQEFIEAYDHGDAAAVAAQWVPDGEYIIGERSVRGREAIAKLYADFFREHPGSQMKVKIDSIRLLAPTVAIEQGTASVSNSPNGPPTSSALHGCAREAGQ